MKPNGEHGGVIDDISRGRIMKWQWYIADYQDR